jgi:hypothetical protein
MPFDIQGQYPSFYVDGVKGTLSGRDVVKFLFWEGAYNSKEEVVGRATVMLTMSRAAASKVGELMIQMAAEGYAEPASDDEAKLSRNADSD